MTLTIEDIRNPARKSGFNYVSSASPGPNSQGGPATYWRAERGRPAHTGTTGGWRGRCRATPEEAAQEYCDHMSSGAAPSAPAMLKRAVKQERPDSPRRTLTARERKLRKHLQAEMALNPIKALHPPVCYLVGIKGDQSAVKIGHADYNVFSRLDSLQTGNSRQLTLLATLIGGSEKESELHRKYQDYNVLNEWFKPHVLLLREFGLAYSDYFRRVKA